MRRCTAWLVAAFLGAAALAGTRELGSVDFWPGRTLHSGGTRGWLRISLDAGSGSTTILPESMRLDSAWIVDGVLLFEVEKRRGCLRRVDSLAWRVRHEVDDRELAALCKERRATPQGWVVLRPNPGFTTREIFRKGDDEARRETGRYLDPDTSWDGPSSNQWLSFKVKRKGELHFGNRDGQMDVTTDGIGRVLHVDRDPGHYLHRNLEAPTEEPVAKHRVAVLPKAGPGVDSVTLDALGIGLEGMLRKEAGFVLVERRSLSRVLAERALQQSGACGSDLCLREAGALAGAEWTLVGNFGKVGKLWVASLRLVDATTGQVMATSDRTWNTDLKTVVSAGLADAAGDLSRGIGARPLDAPSGRADIPAGCFRMGSEQGGDDEKPVHEVCLEAFRMDRTEVTNASYDSCVASGKCSRAHYEDGSCHIWSDSAESFLPGKVGKSFQEPGKPVVCVDWDQASAFCKFRKGKLPTEAQWEYAARAGSVTFYPWGNLNDSICRWANAGDRTMEKWRGRSQGTGCSDGAANTARVGSYRPNAWGLYDMIGNAWEWANDWYWEGMYARSNRQDPQGPPSGVGKVSRGGGWLSDPSRAYVSIRDQLETYTTHDGQGFRCVEPVR